MNGEVFDDRICDQPLAHLSHPTARGFLGIGLDGHGDEAAGAHLVDVFVAQSPEGPADGFALGIENARARRDPDLYVVPDMRLRQFERSYVGSSSPVIRR